MSLGSSLLRLGKDKILQQSETRLKMEPKLSLGSTGLREKGFNSAHMIYVTHVCMQYICTHAPNKHRNQNKKLYFSSVFTAKLGF